MVNALEREWPLDSLFEYLAHSQEESYFVAYGGVVPVPEVVGVERYTGDYEAGHYRGVNWRRAVSEISEGDRVEERDAERGDSSGP